MSRSPIRRRLRSSVLALALALLAGGLTPGCGDDDGAAAGPCRGLCVEDCGCVSVAGEVVDLPSPAKPADTPGSPGVVVDPNSSVARQFGTTDVDLNQARFTRYHVEGADRPDAIVVLVPGFEGGASDMRILAEELLPRALEEHDLLVEVWAYDRRSDQLEDRSGLVLAGEKNDAQLALDWLFGAELGLDLSPELTRRAVIHNPTSDIPFLANWSPLVFSRDLDVIIETARDTARGGNVFLGGHSAGTGFTARYAGTDFNLDGEGAPEPGYTKLRGLVLLEGGGGNVEGDPVTDETLDRIEARFDGGLYHAVRDAAPRCTDGTPCTVATEAADCGHLANPRCVNSTFAYAQVPGLLNPRVLAAIEPAAIQGQSDPDGGQVILQVDQNGILNNDAVQKVPDLAGLSFLPQATVMGAVGGFVDDDGFVAGIAAFVAMSVGFRGPTVDGLGTWSDITESVPPQAFVNNGAAPTTLPGRVWAIEKEPTDFARLLDLFIGETNFLDWYYPSSGLGITAGLPSLDTSALSLDPPAGRGRRDIDNVTQTRNIDIPVICFGGSNGLTPVTGSFVTFANSIAACRAPSCDGSTPRVVDANVPNPAFPTLGNVAGGFEAYISEGYAHVDVVTANDGPDNLVVGPLAAFLARNTAR